MYANLLFKWIKSSVRRFKPNEHHHRHCLEQLQFSNDKFRSWNGTNGIEFVEVEKMQGKSLAKPCVKLSPNLGQTQFSVKVYVLMCKIWVIANKFLCKIPKTDTIRTRKSQIISVNFKQLVRKNSKHRHSRKNRQKLVKNNLQKIMFAKKYTVLQKPII